MCNCIFVLKSASQLPKNRSQICSDRAGHRQQGKITELSENNNIEMPNLAFWLIKFFKNCSAFIWISNPFWLPLIFIIWTKERHFSKYILCSSKEHVWNNTRVSKWWQNFNFWLNYPRPCARMDRFCDKPWTKKFISVLVFRAAKNVLSCII